MPIITLISDWSRQDHYLALVKASILSNFEQVSIVDVSHQISPFNISQAAFVLRSCWKSFPAGTVHLFCVNTENSPDDAVLCIEMEKHYFILADNGLSGILFDEEPSEVVRINKWKSSSSFKVPEIFVPAACHLARGGKPAEFGTVISSWNRLSAIIPVVEESVIIGSVVYIDSYKNAITNITKELFEQTGKGRPFEIFVQSNHYKITKINKTYNETSNGELLALFNFSGLLEIAIFNGNASDLLSLDTRSVVRIKFI